MATAGDACAGGHGGYIATGQALLRRPLVNERLYMPSDLPSVIEVYTASIRALAAPFYSPEQIAAWAPATPSVERWQQRLASVQTFVADCDGVLAGFASYRPDGYFDLLFTHPAFARRGVATALLPGRVSVTFGRLPESLYARQPCCPPLFRPSRLSCGFRGKR